MIRMMGVQYTKFRDDTTSIPGENPSTITFGENIPGGPLESLVMRITTANTTNAVLADFGNMIQSLRFTLNGTVLFDFRSGVYGGNINQASQFGYFLNSIGGRSVEKPSDLTKEAYFVIPIGRQIVESVGRIEAVIGYAGANAAVASGTFQLWGRYNTSTQTQTTVVPSTSFNHAISIEQVVVRIPQDAPGVVAGILVSNDDEADAYGSQGVRIMASSAYGLDADFLRTFNGDLNNGVLYADDDASTTALTFAQEVPGCLFIPTYNLVGGDVVLQVDSSTVTTRTYTPVMIAPFNAKAKDDVRQTAQVVGNTSKAILAKTE